MNTTTFDTLIRYFQDESKSLEVEAKRANIYSNKSDAGSRRENILFDFLKRHLPSRCDVIKGGYVFDSDGNKSKQIDLIVTNDLTLQFKQSREELEKSFTCIEGCYCAISVKSYLNRDELIDSIDGLRSVPKEKNFEFSPVVSNPEIINSFLPSRYIFAYGGISLKSLKKHLDLYLREKDLTTEVLPDFILVNDKYYLSKVPLGGHNDPRGFMPPGLYVQKTQGKFIGGVGLVHMLTRLQKLAVVGPYLHMDFDKYYVQLKVAEEAVSGGEGGKPKSEKRSLRTSR